LEKYNNNLKDKSSREGLINNAQLRAFISDNVNFFIALAQDFFATDAKEPIFLDKKKQLNEQNEALNADKAREKKEKIAFTKSLNEYLKKLEKYQVEYEELLTSLDEKLKIVNIGYSEIESILDNLQKLDIDFKDLIPKVPKRYKPTEKQRERLYKFENKLNHYLESVSDRREALNTKAQDKLEVRDLKIDFAKKYNSYISDIQKKTNSHKEILNSKFKELLKSYNEKARKLSQVLEEGKERTIDSIVSKKQIHDLNQSIENKYNILIEEAENKLFPLVNHINRLSLDIDEEQLQGAYKMQYDQMKYQWEQTRDTAQLGIAVEIIDHEFNHLYARINHQLQILNSNDNFNSIKEFKFLEKNFKQLEDKYTLLSPLYRISGATIKDVSCNSIYEYLLEFFEKQIDSYDIQFDVSNSFKNHVIRIKEPIIFTVFINVINNSIYWMRNKEQRVIKLDFIQDTEEIIIANSGDKIPDYRLGSIFELFYSQRPNGRGIGLYLSKQSLNESGLDINANNDKKYNTLKGACFIISKIVD
jgi:K+-sensing histidine kinase KdpD